MKITERFGLTVGQHQVDFIDIDTSIDTPLFLDPFFIGIRKDAWSRSASQTIRNFFQTFVELVRSDELENARSMFDHLHEPNETCLGLSRGNPKGRAIGKMDADKLFASIVGSDAVSSGVVEDLEDFRLFIPGIDKDKISDMTTNIVRRHLIDYTISQCELWGIPVDENRPTGFYWSAAERRWRNDYANCLVVDGKRILLTPKGVVSFVKKYTPKKYYSSFVLEYLQHENIEMMTSLVQHRKDGSPFVTKVSLTESIAPFSKEFVSEFTKNHPRVFADFKEWAKNNSSSIKNYEICADDPVAVSSYLIDQIRNIPSGPDSASRYHRLCTGALEYLLYPNLTSPVVEREINEGRKRIDIVFDNAAQAGFFHRVHAVSHVPAQFIMVECKNYTKDIANPEVDQLVGRFSVNHGCVGLLLFREVNDMRGLLAKCSDAWLANRHLIVPICDEDLIQMLIGVTEDGSQIVEEFFSSRYRTIAMRSS
ncbi:MULTISPECIES: hypothetical protein [unclassified Pseudoxanthomonas]|uniref:hypothetical protein n=1 Tax=unclassified Pseudoxanthomonas TaxID=2645906 RepID=UPI00161FAF01|nr:MULTISPECIES: hypothetical protein [unclassified Pseudoxanthomonas]MBB3278083.1 hypothetical protein [Pseudoxanthomonas sp. OG2]MBV7475936.1 hypothetical protein [Pseudoxanthomonas sp. PXM05]